MFVSFNVNNDIKGGRKDAWVSINGNKNKLTAPDWKYYNNNRRFEYVITTGQDYSADSVKVNFSDGKYEITNVRCYVIDKDSLVRDVDPFMIDKKTSHGDVINGTIDVKNDGYFTISIPYTDGFTAEIDGKEVQCEKTDTAFLGFKIPKGSHSIKITFTAPLLHKGIALSAAGLLIFIICVIIDRRKSKASK